MNLNEHVYSCSPENPSPAANPYVLHQDDFSKQKLFQEYFTQVASSSAIHASQGALQKRAGAVSNSV